MGFTQTLFGLIFIAFGIGTAYYGWAILPFPDLVVAIVAIMIGILLIGSSRKHKPLA